MIVLLGFIAAKTSIAQTIASFFASLLTIPVFGKVFKIPKFSTIDPKITQRVVVVILAIDFGISVGWGGWSYYQATRAINVLSQISLSNSTNVLPGGHTTLDVDVTAERTRIELVLRATDTNSGAGSCVPNTILSLTPGMAGNRGEEVTANPGIPVRLNLPEGTRHLHLDIAVTNTRDDHNCAVDLSVTSAKLQNG